MIAVLGLRLTPRVRQRQLELMCRSSGFVRHSVVTEYGGALYSRSRLLSSLAEVALSYCCIICTTLRGKIFLRAVSIAGVAAVSP